MTGDNMSTTDTMTGDEMDAIINDDHPAAAATPEMPKEENKMRAKLMRELKTTLVDRLVTAQTTIIELEEANEALKSAVTALTGANKALTKKVTELSTALEPALTSPVTDDREGLLKELAAMLGVTMVSELWKYITITNRSIRGKRFLQVEFPIEYYRQHRDECVEFLKKLKARGQQKKLKVETGRCNLKFWTS